MRVLDLMGRKTKGAVLALSVVMVVFGGQAVRGTDAPQRADSPKATLQQASVTVPDQKAPLVVQAALSSNTRGWSHGSGTTPAADQGVRPELIDAYALAVALAPTGCHLSVSLLAAIGQVESGNLAGQRIDARNRVVPGVLGPVLDGSTYAKIPDTDGGKWDGQKTWDRALGPLQLLPASWRVAGMDADGDGLRDPQNVYDAAGAAMVYLCDGGRDLGTREGLEAGVLAYNHSRDYLRLVLAWKTVFDTADITGLGSTPTLGAWAAPTLFAPTPTRAAGGSKAQSPTSSSPEPGTTATASSRPSTVSSTATDTSAGATASNPAATSGKPGTEPGGKPGTKPGGKPDTKPGDKPGDNPDPDEDPTCVLPDGTTTTVDGTTPTVDGTTPTDDPSALPSCCLTIDPTQPTETPTPIPSEDPSMSPSELLDLCATETPTPTATPTP